MENKIENFKSIRVQVPLKNYLNMVNLVFKKETYNKQKLYEFKD